MPSKVNAKRKESAEHSATKATKRSVYRQVIEDLKGVVEDEVMDDLYVTGVGISDEMLQEMTPWVAIVALKKAINNNAKILGEVCKKIKE